MNGELLKRAAGGDKNAEEEVLKEFTPLVKSVAARFFLSGGENGDLVQEGMFGLCQAVRTFNGEVGGFPSYAHACVRNAVIDAVKKSRSKKNYILNSSLPLEIVDLSPAEPDGEMINKENKREFFQKISNRLSSLEFKTIVMYLDGMGVSEISDALEKPTKSVSNALSRAKTKLIKLYS